jgi:transitional endoplasmic reticulum ATPase
MATTCGSGILEIGGLRAQLQRLREWIEWPLRHEAQFQHLGLASPRGILLSGPPGCGKTLLVQAVARESHAVFARYSAPELRHRCIREGEEGLARVFNEAAAKRSSVLFLDEIEFLAPHPELPSSEAERRIAAQLLSLIDGLKGECGVIVVGATSAMQRLDPALRAPGRLDHELVIPIPDRTARRQILEVQTRNAPLGADVQLERLAALTRGYVGADLATLCQEAGLSRLRRSCENGGGGSGEELQMEARDFFAALRRVEGSAARELFLESTWLHWSDIGGLTAIKRRLAEAIEWPVQHAEESARAGVPATRAILLQSEPGCGKTLLARAAACESGSSFLPVRANALLCGQLGDPAAALRDAFRKARQGAPCILFLDELETLCPARREYSAAAQGLDRLTAQLHTELDALAESRGVMVLASTSSSDLVDPSFLRPGRFDEVIHIGLPDEQERTEILAIHLRDRPVDAAADCAHLARQTEGFSGAELTSLCEHASRLALRRSVSAQKGAGPLCVRQQDLLDALDAVRGGRRRHFA